MSKRKYNYHTVNLPMGLAVKINEAIESGKHGFKSIPDFVKEAVGKYLKELGYLE
jgi:Arc/MetJ-type ribon-helix-helix transcriptional regulator